MKSLETYINESFDRYLKLSDKDKNTLLKLDFEYHRLIEEFSLEQVHFMNIENSGEEVKRICKLIDNDKGFEINIKYEDSKFKDNKWCKELLDKLNDLRNKFYMLDSFISKYYIAYIEKVISSVEFLNKYSNNDKTTSKFITKPPKHIFDEAVKILREVKYEDDKNFKDEYEHTISPEIAKERLQKIIDDQGYGWKVIIDDNMVPRMSVRPYKEFRISSNCKFSEVDLKSLEIHEINVHTARKYYGLQSGLFLFLYGLDSSNIYDEGIAIYNSLNKLDKPKPNILFYIAIKIVTLYKMAETTPYETFKFIKDLTGAPDDIIVLNMIRVSRISNNTTLFSNSANSDSRDMDYLVGYTLVKDMTDEEREDLIKYSIGPQQLFELDTIKKFLNINKFKPLDYKK